MTTETFPHVLTFESRSYECRLAIFGCTTPDEDAPCLPVRHVLRRYLRDASHGVGVAGDWLDCGVTGAWPWGSVALDCSNAQVAAHLNGVIWRILGNTERSVPLFAGAIEYAPYFDVSETHVNMHCPAVAMGRSVGWRKTTGRNRSAGYPELPQLPALLNAHSTAVDGPIFFGRVRVMVIEAMDAAGLFAAKSG